ncbi:MAG: hypothetical protein HY558_04940, partial [Euryarchaeota archaeon]|nr:hypothetical protein [Euryarchaeota archaeon]
MSLLHGLLLGALLLAAPALAGTRPTPTPNALPEQHWLILLEPNGDARMVLEIVVPPEALPNTSQLLSDPNLTGEVSAGIARDFELASVENLEIQLRQDRVLESFLARGFATSRGGRWATHDMPRINGTVRLDAPPGMLFLPQNLGRLDLEVTGGHLPTLEYGPPPTP